MNVPKIDIIVPVYNVEPYLRKCVDSLLNQTYDDYIISLVDDGSPDECPVICDEYAINYPEKIRVYHKQNGGLSDARNYAVERSKSEFVIFVDSDDWVSERFIQNLVEGLTSSEIDMVVSPYYRATETSEGFSIYFNMSTKAPCAPVRRFAQHRQKRIGNAFRGLIHCPQLWNRNRYRQRLKRYARWPCRYAPV